MVHVLWWILIVVGFATWIGFWVWFWNMAANRGQKG